MSVPRIEVLPDPSMPNGGYAVIKLHTTGSIPDTATYRIDPVGTLQLRAKGEGWPSGDLHPVAIRRKPRWVELLIGPDVVEAPELKPGTRVSVTVPQAEVSVNLRWPDLTSRIGRPGALAAGSSSPVAGRAAAREANGKAYRAGAEGDRRLQADDPDKTIVNPLEPVAGATPVRAAQPAEGADKAANGTPQQLKNGVLKSVSTGKRLIGSSKGKIGGVSRLGGSSDAAAIEAVSSPERADNAAMETERAAAATGSAAPATRPSAGSTPVEAEGSGKAVAPPTMSASAKTPADRDLQPPPLNAAGKQAERGADMGAAKPPEMGGEIGPGKSLSELQFKDDAVKRDQNGKAGGPMVSPQADGSSAPSSSGNGGKDGEGRSPAEPSSSTSASRADLGRLKAAGIPSQLLSQAEALEPPRKLRPEERLSPGRPVAVPGTGAAPAARSEASQAGGVATNSAAGAGLQDSRRSRTSSGAWWALAAGLVLLALGTAATFLAGDLQRMVSGVEGSTQASMQASEAATGNANTQGGTALAGLPGGDPAADAQPIRLSQVDAEGLFATAKISPRGVDATRFDRDEALARADAFLRGSGGQPVDKAEAAFWLRTVLARDLIDAKTTWVLTQLGTTYAAPENGVKPDYAAAAFLWTLAGAAGDPVAFCFLGQLHEFGLGMPASRALAREKYDAAKRLGGCNGLDAALARVSG